MKNRRHSAGFTLVELIVGMVVAAVVLVGVAGMFQKQVQESINVQDEAELQASIQAVANMISNTIVMAGFGNTTIQPIVHTNVAGATIGADSVQFFSSADLGGAIATHVYAGSVGVSGTDIFVRCYGEHGQGGPVDTQHDAVKVGAAPLLAYFVNPFKGTLVQGITNPQTIVDTDPTSTGSCRTDQPYDYDNQTVGGIANDPVIALKLSPGLTSPIPRGTTVYALRGSPSVTYSVNLADKALLRNGVPLVLGVEDFQVQFRLKGETTWRNSLAGVSSMDVHEVAFAMVVRSAREHAALDWRESVDVFDHTLTFAPEDRRVIRKVHEFRVRPKNTAL